MPHRPAEEAPSAPPFSQADYRAAFSVGPAPEWAWEREVAWDTPHRDDEHVLLLLADTQHDPVQKITHERNVRRLNSPEAVQKLSHVEIDFDPETQRLVVHEIRVWRQGEYKSYADPNRFFFRQREDSLEAQILHGRVSAIVVLDDVRPGDALELSYSLTTTRELPGKKFEFSFLADKFIRTAAWSVTLRLPKDLVPNHRQSHGTPLEPQIYDGGDAYLWTWSGVRDKAQDEEPGTPIWEPQLPWIQISAYSSWNEVAEIVLSNWRGLMEAGVAEAAGLFPDDPALPIEDRALKAIRFVQDEIRYLGLEIGLGGLLPSSPDAVLTRRFGDCKDKSLLLACLLRAMGIEAHPVLVHTAFRHTVEQLLPGLGCFNHVIVTFVIDGRWGFADPTALGAGGRLFEQCLPHYGKGLCVAEGTGDLLDLPLTHREHSRWYIREDFHVALSSGPHWMDQCIEAAGFEADVLRARLSLLGRESFAKEEAQGLHSFFPDLHPDPQTSLLIKDDRDANHLQIEGRFLFKEWGAPAHGSPRIFRYNARWLGHFLACPPQQPPRRHSFALRFPLNILHEVTVHGPVGDGPPEDYNLDTQWFRARTKVRRMAKRSCTLTYLYQNIQNTVPPNWAGEYGKQFSKMTENLGCNVPIHQGRSLLPSPLVCRSAALKTASRVPIPMPSANKPAAQLAVPRALPLHSRESQDGDPFTAMLAQTKPTRWRPSWRGFRTHWWVWVLVFMGLRLLGAVYINATKPPVPVYSERPEPVPERKPAPPKENMPADRPAALPPKPSGQLADPALALAEDALRRGDLATALSNLEKLERLYPGHPSVEIGWAFLELHRQNPEEARRRALAAQKADPRWPMPSLILGGAALMQRHFEEAEQIFGDLTKRYPDAVDAWMNLGKALAAQGKWDEAEKATTKVLELNPVHTEALHQGMYIALQRKAPEKGLALIRNALEKAPGATPLHILHADYLNEQGDPAGALEAAEKGLKTNPGDPGVAIRKALYLAKLGRREEAAQLASATVLVASDRFDVNDLAGRAYSELGLYEEAVKAHAKMAELAPGNPMAANTYGYSLQLVGKTAEAREQYKKALALDPRLLVAWENLRNLAVQTGSMDEARGYEEKIAELRLPERVP